MDLEKVNSLVGKEYDAEHFNCWHLVMELVPTAPKVDVVATKMVGIKYFTDKSYYSDFHEVSIPKDGDIVLLGESISKLHHAGVFVQGGVIHAESPSVVFTTLRRLKFSYKEVRFYRANN